jgi:hypothetical protein
MFCGCHWFFVGDPCAAFVVLIPVIGFVGNCSL